MEVLSVSSEIFPLIKTGGLADVTGSLPKALSSHDIRTRTLVPGYRQVFAALEDFREVARLELLGNSTRVLQASICGLDLYVLDAPELFDRAGGPYVDETGVDHIDNSLRFATLSFAAAELATGAHAGWRPDLVHIHDWQGALTSVYLRYVKSSDLPALLTIHNLAFQGQFPFSRLLDLGLPPEAYSIDCLEYYGDVSFLKGGIQTSDAVTTVSPTYAREILANGLGMGMEGVLKARRKHLYGIVNGLDPEIWCPRTDPYLCSNFDYRTVARRRINRKHLIDHFGLPNGSGPIFSIVSRLTWQKGMDLLMETIPHLVEAGGRLIVCGQGDRNIERQLRRMASLYPANVAVRIGYDEETAHMLHGGSDFVIQPSRFEPCGLTQLYALRYGAVPIVSRTGGLSETIIDANDAAMAAEVATGIQFHPVTAEQLQHALDRAITIFRHPQQFRRLQMQGMKTNFSWDTSARRYAALYRQLTGTGCAAPVWQERKAG
ncbi:MAG: glycogen synthase GlgA [Shinella sp.]|nr:glycogen synthase GlgA [Shinella sp.]